MPWGNALRWPASRPAGREHFIGVRSNNFRIHVTDVLARFHHVGVVLCRADALAQRRRWTSAREAMWSDVGKKAEPRWLWHAIDPHSGTV